MVAGSGLALHQGIDALHYHQQAYLCWHMPHISVDNHAATKTVAARISSWMLCAKPVPSMWVTWPSASSVGQVTVGATAQQHLAFELKVTAS